jgi:hypothetical protein
MDLTRGHFDSNFDGCVRNVVIMGNNVNLDDDDDKQSVSGVNVGECSEDEE